jgi:hypothetical protein
MKEHVFISSRLPLLHLSLLIGEFYDGWHTCSAHIIYLFIAYGKVFLVVYICTICNYY